MQQLLFIGSDHAGFELKRAIVENLSDGYDIVDCGPKLLDEKDDYPDYAQKVCQSVIEQGGRGILICDTGIGMSIAANRFESIRAALVTTPFMAERSRLHNDANVVCLGQDLLDEVENLELVRIWLDTPFSGDERHVRRLEKLEYLE